MADANKIREFLKVKDSYIQKNNIDSKAQFLKFGTMQTINTIWSNGMKLTNDKDQEVEEFKKWNNLIELQKLEAYLYEHGKAALSKDFKALKVINIKENWKRIESIAVLVELESDLNFFEVYKWDDEKNRYIKTAFVNNKKQPYTIEEAKNKAKSYGVNLLNDEFEELPFYVFYNNALKLGDIDLVNNEYFELLNRDINALTMDAYLSSPWLFTPENAELKKRIGESLGDLTKRFITVNANISNYEIDPLRMFQGQSNAVNLLQKLKENITMIKKFMFMKSDTANMGTKNMHNVEAQQLNSDFEDYIEQKANLRELQLLDYFKMFFPSLAIANVLVFGSTKWLTQEAPKYLTDLNGEQIDDKTALNPSRIKEEQDVENL